MLNHQMAIEEEQKKIKNMDQYASQLKAKLRMSDENVSRLENQYIPKLKETKKFQNELYDELCKIKDDAELLPGMFRAEALFRIECKKEKDSAVADM